MQLTTKDKVYCVMRLIFGAFLIYQFGFIIGTILFALAFEAVGLIANSVFGLEPLSVMDAIFMLDHEKNRSYIVLVLLFEKFNAEEFAAHFFKRLPQVSKRLRCVTQKIGGLFFFKELTDAEFSGIRNQICVVDKKEWTKDALTEHWNYEMNVDIPI